MRVCILLLFSILVIILAISSADESTSFDLMEAESESNRPLNRHRRFFQRIKNFRQCWRLSKDPTFVENNKNRSQYKHYKNRYLLKDNNYIKYESCYCKEK
ncbi:uncharacterized protein LOC111045356 [Nilaparvata lugens]|uniref:uncharacterized protein LOC111045356 n=1 Tax=Nilaparvata lugens TaxID=108931 RepID=UPI00193E48F2|nr:uncharacterized protein LOC111045356 [Nilaparvata lugens]